MLTLKSASIGGDRTRKRLRNLATFVSSHDGAVKLNLPLEADAPTWVCKIPTSQSKKLIPNSVGFTLNGTQLGLSQLHVPHSKDENSALRVGHDPKQLIYFQ